MSAKRIILLVDHKVRDLPRLALLKVLLEDQFGHEVALMARNVEPVLAARRWTPDLIVFPFLRGHKWINRVRRLHDAGVQVAVLSSEYWYGELDARAKSLAESEVVREVDRLSVYYATHPGMQAAMEGYQGRALPQIRYTGNPSFDFYVPPLRDLLQTRAQFMDQQALDPAQPVLLVVTSFTQANYLSDTPELAQRSIAFWKTATRDEVIRNQVVHRQMLTDAVVAIARRFPKLNIIIRPHPFEMLKPPGIEFYREAFAEHGLAERFRFLPEGHISHLLNVSDIVLYSWSTVAMEAWLLDLPTVAVRTTPLLDRTLDSTVGQLSEGDALVEEPEAAADLVAQYVGGGAVPDDLRAARRRLLDFHLPHAPGTITLEAARLLDDSLRAADSGPSARLLYGRKYAGRTGPLRYWLDFLRGEVDTGPLDDRWEAWLPPSERIASVEEMEQVVAGIRAALAAAPQGMLSHLE